MERLCTNTLKQLSGKIKTPGYDRSKLRPGIVHLGIGAFHRAHQAYLIDTLLSLQNAGWEQWGIVGCSLRSEQTKHALAEQDYLYSVLEKGSKIDTGRVVGSVIGVLAGNKDCEAILTQMASSETHIVSLTVTEKGYCRHPASGELNFSHPDIVFDLSHIDTPKSAIGYLVSALAKRRQQHRGSFTVLSCDNLPANGDLLRRLCLAFADEIDKSLARWISENTAFPNTMVDRIVPATTVDNIHEFSKDISLEDRGLVVTETFVQWVIEDKFCSARPEFERAGVIMVSDVEAFEAMKLRLLNGSHSLLAFLGCLLGVKTIAEVMQNQALVELCKNFMDMEAERSLIVPAGFDVERYKHQIRERFANSKIKYLTAQVASDSSQKIPQRFLSILKGDSENFYITALAIAAWICLLSGENENGDLLELKDPLWGQLTKIFNENKADSETLVRNILSVQEIFGFVAKTNIAFVDQVKRAYILISGSGAFAGVSSVNSFYRTR